MKELKDSEIKTSPPKKPLIFYYLAALIVLMLLNVFLFPSLLERQVVEVPYSQFLTMADGGQVEQVALDETSREIVFIAKDDGGREGYYKTGVWPDDGQRLLAQLQAEEGAATVGGQHSIARAGRLAVWADHLLHQRPVLRPQRGADEAGGGLRPAFTDRQIGPSESLCVELAFQNLLGMRVFGRHQQAGGATVQPMDRVKVRRISLQIVMPE